MDFPEHVSRSVGRRRFLAGTLGTAGLVGSGSLSAGLFLAGCTDGASPGAANGGGNAGSSTPAGSAVPRPASPSDPARALAAPGSPGLIDEAVYQRRIDDYLQVVTTELDTASILSIAAHLVRAHREPGFSWDSNAVTVDSLQEVWARFDKWKDTRDFSLLYNHWLLTLADGASPSRTLAPDLLQRIKRSMVGNRYRYNDPLPDGVVDEMWFWSENHMIIGLVGEYLAGQRFPDDTFSITGLSGRAHAERCRQPILDWIDERARFGFFEWHSNVYMKKNVEPLLTLVELADDPELVGAAGMALDVCLFDMAAHTHKGVYVASRERSYKKDKMTARDEDTFDGNKFLFDDTDLPYQNRTDTAAIFYCAAKRYRVPQALIDIATASQPGVVRERHGIFLDAGAPVTANPEAPFGYDFNDPANLPFWWSLGALGAWQTTDISLAEAKRFRLFEAGEMAQIKLLIDLNGGDPERVKAWTQANHAITAFGLSGEANTYAWRGDHVSLASVVNYRLGAMRGQVQSWLAAIDADALVFTTHPRSDVDPTTDWKSDGKPGYWTGEASMPRSAQHERTGVHIYQPAWDKDTNALLWAVFNYRPFTHAYFPQDHFDEVVQTGHWTVGRKADGYVALWSWRAPTWRAYDPAVLATNGMRKPFDLVAEGGPDNVWVVEVGERSDGDFESWRNRVTATEPAVDRSPAGFTVNWKSPSSGEIAYGSTGDFTVGGKAQSITDFPRHASRFGTVDRLAKTIDLKTDKARLQLDFDRLTRTLV